MQSATPMIMLHRNRYKIVVNRILVYPQSYKIARTVRFYRVVFNFFCLRIKLLRFTRINLIHAVVVV